MSISDHQILHSATLKEAMIKLNGLAMDAILFVVDEESRLLGSITDGDIRRGILSGKSVEQNTIDFIQPKPKFIEKNNYSIYEIINFRENNFKIIPVLDQHRRIIQIINFRKTKSYLPIDAVLMAGGRGERLKPLTDHVPKPLLKVGNKPIIEHNLDNLILYGVDDFHITLNYLGNQIEEYFSDGHERNVEISYVTEDIPFGTVGGLKLIQNFNNDYILLSNSDILTTLDYEDFFLDFLNSSADLSVFSTPYSVNVPLGVFELDKENRILNIVEKPTYTYYANSGIYLMKKEVISHIPEGTFFNATDLIETLISKEFKVLSYQSAEYWLDIGSPADFEKAQRDILHLK